MYWKKVVVNTPGQPTQYQIVSDKPIELKFDTGSGFITEDLDIADSLLDGLNQQTPSTYIYLLK